MNISKKASNSLNTDGVRSEGLLFDFSSVAVNMRPEMAGIAH